jgi:hypothetical protein
MPSVALQFPSGRGSGRSFLSQLARNLVTDVEELASAIAQARPWPPIIMRSRGSRMSSSPGAASPATPSRDLLCSGVGCKRCKDCRYRSPGRGCS